MANKQKKEAKQVELPIQIEGAEQLPLIYSNHVFVTHTSGEFFVTFSQLHPPYWLAPTKEDIELLTHIPARVVSRIALTPTKMKELIDALEQNYDKYTKQMEGLR
jgi:hypothetical protein